MRFLSCQPIMGLPSCSVRPRSRRLRQSSGSFSRSYPPENCARMNWRCRRFSAELRSPVRESCPGRGRPSAYPASTRHCAWSHSTRGGWIEITAPCRRSGHYTSHPTRGGWMEMTAGSGSHRPCISSPHRLGNRPSVVYSKNPCGVLHHRGHFLPISLQKSPSNAPKGTSALPAHKVPLHILHASPVGFRYTTPAAALSPWERAAACHPALSPFGECAALPASW